MDLLQFIKIFLQVNLTVKRYLKLTPKVMS